MFVAFVVSNLILWFTLALTILLATVLPPMFLELLPVQWFSVLLGGGVVGILVGRSYDILIPSISTALPRPITPAIFAIASAYIVGLAVLASLHRRVTVFDNPDSPELQLVVAAVVAFCAVEMWKFMPANAPWFARLVLSVCAGFVLFAVTLLIPTYLMGAFVDYYNAGFASFAAGWIAGLSSRIIKSASSAAQLEASATGNIIQSLVQRDVPVATAVIFTYAMFKMAGGNPILFTLVVGVVSATLASAVSHIAGAN